MRNIFIIFLIFITTKVAAVSNELCRIELNAVSDSVAQKQLLLSEAFVRVALRVSGQTSVAQNPELRELAQDDLLKLVKNYTFRFQDEQRIFDVLFDYQAVKKRLSTMGFAVLPDNRPYTIIWLALADDQDAQPIILGSDAMSPLRTILQQRAQDFGLPLILPLLDFSDTTAVEVQDVIEINNAPLEAISSSKYYAQNVLVGKLISENEQWHLHMTLLNYPDAKWTITGNSLEKICDTLFNNVAVAMIQASANDQNLLTAPVSAKSSIQTKLSPAVSRLLAEQSTDSSPQSSLALTSASVTSEPFATSVINKTPILQVSLHISGIDDLGKYATIISYLRELDGIRDVEVAELGEDSALFTIESSVTLQELASMIARGNLLAATLGPVDGENEMRFKLV